MFAAVLPRLSDRLLGRPVVCGLMSCILVAGVWRAGAAFPAADRPLSAWLNRDPVDPAAGYPCAAADFVAARVRPTTGRLINEFTWGGYLEWRLGGNYQAFLDGRTQVFTPEFWRATYLSGEGERRRFLADVTADAAVLPARKSLFHDALAGQGWTVAYRDERAEVLLPRRRSRGPSRSGLRRRSCSGTGSSGNGNGDGVRSNGVAGSFLPRHPVTPHQSVSAYWAINCGTG